MALDGEGKLVPIQPVSVVRYQYPRQTALVGLDLDPAGARVDRVLNQFLGCA